ncbi:MAG: acetoacetyl-CoA reductase [Alphaproteobacteria bacterium]
MDRLAFVTGGTRGIGAAISTILKHMGYRVAVNYHGRDDIAQDFTASTGIPAYKWDVGDFESCQEGMRKVTEDQGTPDILVNNAGITRDNMCHKMSFQQWNEVLQTNLSSVFNMTSCVLDTMRSNEFGRIVNISSINGLKGQIGQVNYCAAKSGVIGFTKALAQENAAKGITVNAVAPGYVNTEMVQAVPENIMTNILNTVPMHRLGQPEEVAGLVAYLCSKEAGYITGSTFNINGGQYLQ